jgi:hypothetical protein
MKDGYQTRERAKLDASRALSDDSLSPDDRAAAIIAWAMAHHGRLREPPPPDEYLGHWLASMAAHLEIPGEVMAALEQQGIYPESHPRMPPGATDYMR